MSSTLSFDAHRSSFVVRRSSFVVLALGLLIGVAAALLNPWVAVGVVLAPVVLVALIVLAWDRPAWGLAAVALLIPFQFRLPFSRNWSLASGLVLTGLLFLIWFCGRLAAGNPRMVWCVPPGAAVMGLAAGVSLFVAADPIAGVKKLIYFGGFFVLFLLVPNLVRTPRQLQAVTRGLVWAGALAALAGIAQFFAQFYYGPLPLLNIWMTSLAPILEGPHAAEEFAGNNNWMLWVHGVPVMRALGPFMGPPDVAQFMAICTPLALVGALAGGRMVAGAVLRGRRLSVDRLAHDLNGRANGRANRNGRSPISSGNGRTTEASRAVPALVDGNGERAATQGRPYEHAGEARPGMNGAALAAFLVMVVFLALTFARQSWVAALAMFPVLMVLGTGYRSFSARMGWAALAGLVVLVTLLAALPTSSVASRFFSIVNPQESSNMERFRTWEDGLDGVERFPLFGTGIGNFFTAIGAGGPGAYSHNAYLDVWAETGPLGLVGFLLLLGWAWWMAARIYRDAREPVLRGFGLAALGTLAWLAVLFFFDDMLYSSRSGPAIWLELGLLVAARRMQALGVRR